MNSLQRTWLTLQHKRKFAKLGKRCRYPIPQLHIQGHVEQGDNGRFRNNATMRTHGDGKIIWSERSGASWGCLFEASELIHVGTYTAVAEFTYVTDTLFDFRLTEGGWKEVPRIVRPVHIGHNCFVGSGCYIGPGVTIHDGAVVAHHSVVTRDVGPLEIWGGAPARKLGHRTENVPASRMAEFEALVAQQGIQGDRYLD